jgi:NADH:ubiquinone oxidoreductase subunit F (NADH-binding)/(2Fe-2S) ferredoxin
MGEILERYNKIKEELDYFSTDAKGQGKTIIQVGSATCENAAGAELVKNEFQKLINASGRSDIIIKQTGCTGRCSQEPIVGIFAPNTFPVKYQKVTVDKVSEIFQNHIINGKPIPSYMLDKKTDILYRHVITFCETNYEKRPDHIDLSELFKQKLQQKNVPSDEVRVLKGGNIGLSKFEDDDKHAVMIVFPENVIYRYDDESAMDEIIDEHIINGKICDKYKIHTEALTEEYMRFYGDVSFFNKQSRITLRNCGIIDPENIGDYIHAQGFKALAKVLDANDRNWVIDEILASGLRGRGGGGYPTGIKWRNTATLSNDPIKYVICNADEGDPGAFMDRSALEGDPFSIVEGMAIGAFAVGASKGFVYIRAEYPLAIKRIENAIKISKENGFLGNNILGSDFSFDIEIRLGAGAFVCGEETALIHSIEGKRGQPRMRPPYPSLSGLWGHPTCINNVETWANVPPIIIYGAEWFNRIGTSGSKGTKVFALAGKVKNTGLIEVPMGTTLREVIYDIGGGIPNGELKAIQTGGPSGGCIPADLIDTPIDYETLKNIGSMMGSGGMIVLDNTDCMVQTAKFFLEFTKDESCGKCLPCREGTLRMLEILEKITEGKGEPSDLDKLERLGKMIKKTSLCGLGQSAPNPVLSMLQGFREEFLVHVTEHRCPTQKCQKLIKYMIIPDKCTGCTLCAKRCPVSCIIGARKQIHEIIQDQCIKCGECYNVCKFDAIEKI